MAQPRQEYQLLSILGEQLKSKYQELTPEDKKALKKGGWWLHNEGSLEIVKKMHEILATFEYKSPVESRQSADSANSSKTKTVQKKRIKFQVR